MKIITLATSLLLLSTLVSATVYENAEDGKTTRWSISKADKTTKVLNKFDDTKDSRVIKFKVKDRSTAFCLGAPQGPRAWNNDTENIIKWNMKFSKKFQISVIANTTKGIRVFQYTHKDYSKGLKRGKYIAIGLGASSKSGEWVSISQNLKKDLAQYEPDNTLLAINAFKVQGAGKLDDIKLVKDSTSPLVLSEVEAIEVTANHARVVWDLNHVATGQVEYGTTTAYGSVTKKEESFDYSTHRQHLRNLIPNTTYHYRVISVDQNGNRVVSADHTFFTATSPLVLSEVEAIEVTENHARIVWDLNHVATGQVEYGTTTAYGSMTKKEESFDYATHRQHIRNLMPDTTYHYRVISVDQKGNRVVSQDHTFTTASVPLKLSEVEAIEVTSNHARVVWDLNHVATGQVEYGTTSSYGSVTKKEESFDYATHRQHLRNLIPNTTYHYRVISVDQKGNRIVSKDHTFTTRHMED